jgi:hypothetical protein
MAPEIGGANVASDNKLDPLHAIPIVGTGIPLCFLTLPLW